MINISEFITELDTVAVALSGGKDSMALLDVLLKAMPKNRVKAINIEHGIRGESSLKDTAFVVEHCKKLEVELLCYSADVPLYCKQNSLSIEEGARIVRYNFFNQAIEQGFCTKVATAHHKSDSVETTLFNLFRGASPSGTSPIASTNTIIRPLINLTREEIDLYVDKNHIPFVQDETNFDEKYTRNFIRNKVLPLIKQVFPECENSISRFSQIASEQDEFVTSEALKVMQGENEISFPIDLPSAVRHKCVILTLKKLGLEKDYEQRHAKEIDKLLLRKNGDVVDLPNQIKAVKDYGKITFYKKQELKDYCLPFKVGKTQINGKEIIVEKFHAKQNMRFDLDKIPTSCVFRPRQEGDKFTPFASCEKKLKKYLIDKKIPCRKRDELIVLADGNEIYLIVGVEISDKIKVDKNSTNIYTITQK